MFKLLSILGVCGLAASPLITKNSSTEVKAEDFYINYNNHTQDFYYTIGENEEFGAHYTFWDFSSIASSHDEFIENYSLVSSYNADEGINVNPKLIYDSPQNSDFNFKREITENTWGLIENTKQVEEKSYDAFVENATWVSTDTYSVENEVLVQINFGVMLNFIEVDGMPQFEFFGGFSGYVSEKVDFDIHMQFEFGKNLLFTAK